MTAAFLDTVGLLALWDIADQWHAAAEAVYLDIMSRRSPVVTTNFILLECGNAAARRPYRSQVITLRKTLEQRQELIVPTDQDWADAWIAYEGGHAGQEGIVDHVSFSVMRRLEIAQAFTNYRHFAAAGFTVLF